MDYTYSVSLEEETLMDCLTLREALKYLFMFIQLFEGRSITIFNQTTNEIVLEYAPGNRSFDDSWVSDKIKEI